MPTGTTGCERKKKVSLKHQNVQNMSKFVYISCDMVCTYLFIHVLSSPFAPMSLESKLNVRRIGHAGCWSE